VVPKFTCYLVFYFQPTVLSTVVLLVVLRPSSVVCLSSSVTLCIVAKRCVLEQKLLLRAYREVVYEKSIGTKMNDLDLCLEVISRSRQPLRYIDVE